MRGGGPGPDLVSDARSEPACASVTSEKIRARAPQDGIDVPSMARLFERLGQSKFRSGFHLRKQERAYFEKQGRAKIEEHARDFIRDRLAPAEPRNDGKQTPWRGHPVFIAQHATGCCCRGCLSKWHHIPAHQALSDAEQCYIVSVLMCWIDREMSCNS